MAALCRQRPLAAVYVMFCFAWLQLAVGSARQPGALGKHGNTQGAVAGTAAAAAPTAYPGSHIIVTTVRKEDDFIVEWLNYHLWIGFDHVVIYCQDDGEEGAEAMRAKLSAYVAGDLVTVIHWPAIGDQMGVFRDFSGRYERDGLTFLLTGVDEFLVLCGHATVGEFLRAIQTKPNDCLHFPVLQFGTAHIAEHPKGLPVMTTYHLRHREALLSSRSGHPGQVLLARPVEVKPQGKHGRHDGGCGLWRNVTERSLEARLARLHHYALRGGILDSYRILHERGWPGYGFASADSDVRRDKESWNEVSDPTMFGIFSEYPGGALMLARPPSTRRSAREECRDPVEIWKPK